jgi:protein SCO1
VIRQPSVSGRRFRSVAAASRVAIAALGLALAAALAGCGGSGSSGTANADFAGQAITPPKPAPRLRLSNYNGDPVNIHQFRGKAVLVTFLYTHCPDVCPVIVGNLHAAQNELGSGASNLQIIAVSVDPKGDTPKTVASFLKDRQMAGRMDWLIGSRPELERTWKAWGIATNVPKKSPELVEHSAEIFGIDSQGDIQTLYPANFKPAQIVHDVPLLAAG